ncbi:MFS transporter [Bacillus sp. 03113]|uniref:MDR family MFS transporter n=1 Tax=Bacillus sp. 03113 TaxID=2578211 RepID=UPI00114164B7|nr:MFS transporter [Bacillus sp. 03113]
MRPLKMLLSKYDAPIWIRVFGSALTSTTNFMLRPFLVLYLYNKLDESILLPLLVVGLQPLASILISIWGGGLADRFGRKPIMVISLLIQAVSMIGFIFADSVWEFAGLSILLGLGIPLFVPAANAQIADVVSREKRAEVFALLHTAFNIGPAIGPLLGLAVFTWNQQVVFASSAIAFFIYAFAIWIKVPETLPKVGRVELQAAPKLSFIKHRQLYLFTLYAVPIGLLYAQVETTLPLHLKSSFANYLTILTVLFTLNAIIVIIFMVWIAKKTEKINSKKLIFLSFFLFALVGIGYGNASSFFILILVEIVFTLGEMIGVSHLQKFISGIAPKEMRGRYFSIFGLYMQIPKLIGPSICGILMTNFGGQFMFTILGVLLILAGFLQNRLIKKIQLQSGVNHEKPFQVV